MNKPPTLHKLISVPLFCSMIFIFLSFGLKNVSAQEGIDLSAVVTYEIQRDGKTKVLNDISITNLNSRDYAKNFSLNVYKYVPKEIKVYENNSDHSKQLITNGSKSTIFVEFSNNVVGIGSKRYFKIEYTIDDLSEETGEIWEITIPKLDNASIYSNYNAILSIPKVMGDLAYITPIEDSYEEDDERNYYVFTKEKLIQTSVTAGFGEFQVFNFELNYHIVNPSKKTSIFEIALPPDTSTQTMLYDSINPIPKDVALDIDGNWMAQFELTGGQTVDVKVNGKAQIFATPRRLKDLNEIYYENLLKPTKYWQSDDVTIQNFAKRLGTPENIYEFTKSTLSYNYDRATPEAERMGALNALKNPEQAICMEFTDLFIALARAAGIPAREIIGYAYTENPELQPLSLSNDVLHSWPEYWDKEKKVWIPVDPTWGSTSNQDYFNTFDLRHIAFVVHGSDPEQPYSAGSYKEGNEPSKDVYVEFGEIKEIKNSEIILTHQKYFGNPFTKGEVVFKVFNSGPRAIYSAPTKIYFDNQLVDSRNLEVLPPFSFEDIKVNVDKGILLQNTPNRISLVLSQANLEIDTKKNIYILINLTVLTFVLVITTFVLYIRIRSNKQ